MPVKNLTEDVVRREFDRLAPTVAGFCGCSICRDDVIVYALNRLKPHYVTQHRGAVLQHLEMQKDQETADVSVALLNGFRLVTSKPRPNHLELARRGGTDETV